MRNICFITIERFSLEKEQVNIRHKKSFIKRNDRLFSRRRSSSAAGICKSRRGRLPSSSSCTWRRRATTGHFQPEMTSSSTARGRVSFPRPVKRFWRVSTASKFSKTCPKIRTFRPKFCSKVIAGATKGVRKTGLAFRGRENLERGAGPSTFSRT